MLSLFCFVVLGLCFAHDADCIYQETEAVSGVLYVCDSSYHKHGCTTDGLYIMCRIWLFILKCSLKLLFGCKPSQAAELSMRRHLVAVCETGLYHVMLMRHFFLLSLQEGQRLRAKLCSWQGTSRCFFSTSFLGLLMFPRPLILRTIVQTFVSCRTN